MKTLTTLLLAGLLPACAAVQTQPALTPDPHVMGEAATARLDSTLQQFVAAGQVAGVSAVV